MKDPADMNDDELFEHYQKAKEQGPTLLIDELQLEIAQRWEDELLEAQESGEVFEGEQHGNR